MNNATLNLEVRTEVGGERPKRLRKSGYIPAVLYGHGMESVNAQVKASDLREFLAMNGRNAVFITEFAAESDLSVLVKDIQYDPLRKSISHIDFQRVSMTEKVTNTVPVRVLGKENVERDGNVIVYQLKEIAIECLPQDVPRYIDVDVSGMTLGHSLTAGQLQLPDGATLVSAPGSIILSVTGGRLELKAHQEDEPVITEEEKDKPSTKKI